MKTEHHKFHTIKPDENGWRLLPNNSTVRFGYSVSIGNNVEFRGVNITIGNNVFIDDGVIINSDVSIGNSSCLRRGCSIGSSSRLSYHVTVGMGTKIMHSCEIGNDTTIDRHCIVQENVIIGNNVFVTSEIVIGNNTRIGNSAYINQSTEKLNKYFISTFPKKSILWKWVVKRGNRYFSPMWGTANEIEYKIGKTVTEPNAVVSDIQCDRGLHVFRHGIRPEFHRLAARYSLALLEVEVKREDICFGGLPGNIDKIRVKKLKVIREIDVFQYE